jgi:hypothetical protein
MEAKSNHIPLSKSERRPKEKRREILNNPSGIPKSTSERNVISHDLQ